MYKKALVAIVVLAMISMMLAPAFAWEYPDGTSDTLYETFGPRADSMLIKLYGSEVSEWEAGLEGGEIDVTDWPLDHTHLVKYTTAPWDAELNVYGYGAEFGAYLFDLNNNNNTYLDNPPNPAYPNPRYPNPMGYSVAESGITEDNGFWLRHAIAHLVNRDAVISTFGSDVETAIYAPIPPCYGIYAHPDIKLGGALEDLTHPYDPETASSILNNSGMFPFGPDGWRYWDRNRNGVYDGASEDLLIDLVARTDHLPRLCMAQNLRTELEAASIKIHVKWNPMTIMAARQYYMVEKKGHIYTAGWTLGSTPDFLTLWHWKYYWHPGRSYNTGGCNKDAFNDAADGVQYANSQDDAITACRAAQVAFCQSVLGVAVYANIGYKAMSKTYIGPEAGYTGENWYGVVNWQGYGIDNAWTFLNMHTATHDVGGTIRYGFKTTDLRQLNPIYTEWLWDNKVIDLIGYDSLVARNPYTLDFMPWVSLSFTAGTYVHPTYGTCTKVKFTLRNDVYFQDGEQLTIADVAFTFIEIDDLLAAWGLPPPWWISNVQDILDFSVLDPLNFEVLLDVKSMWAIGWIGGNRILPKHIWKPICEGAIAPKSGLPWDPTSFAPDPNLIGSGVWRLDEYVPDSHILLVANTPGSVVDTGIVEDPNKNSAPVTSPKGYFRLGPMQSDVHVKTPTEYMTKLDLVLPATTLDVSFSFSVTNQWLSGSLTVDEYAYFNDSLVLLNLGLSINSEMTFSQDYARTLPLGYCTMKVAVKIVGPDPNPWIGNWVNTTLPIWITILEDIGGGYYVDPQLPAPDIRVNIVDFDIVDKAFGSVPGDSRWSCVADIDHDYDIGLPEYFAIGNKVGWPLLGDVNNDRKVDLKDVFAVGMAFGSVRIGDEYWHQAPKSCCPHSLCCDLNCDGKIDLRDYYNTCKNFGKTVP